MTVAKPAVPAVNRMYAFYELLVQRIPPRSQSDRTCFRNLARWLQCQIDSAELAESAYHQVLTFATEAAQPGARNPAAMFMSLVKKEMGYDPKASISSGRS